MKKVLLTSTALVAFAGAAAAEVTLSGWAELGVVGGEGIETQFWNDVDVDFTLSGEADNGLVFGANVDLDEAAGLGAETDDMGIDVFVSGDFGTVTLGDTDGALDWAVSGVDAWGNPGSIADDETAHWGRQDTWLDGTYDGQILRYDYTFEDFGFAVSLEQDDRSDTVLDNTKIGEDANGNDIFGDDRDDYNWAVGARYTPELGAGTLNLGIGYQAADNGQVGFGLTDLQVENLAEDILAAGWTADELEAFTSVFGFNPQSDESDELTVSLGEDTKVWALSAGYTADSGWSIGGVYSDWSGEALDKGEYWGIGAGYAYEAFSIHLNYGEHKFEYKGDADASLKTKGYGLALGYDMGGGLSILAGYGKSDAKIAAFDESVDTDFDTYSLGLSMAF